MQSEQQIQENKKQPIKKVLKKTKTVQENVIEQVVQPPVVVEQVVQPPVIVEQVVQNIELHAVDDIELNSVIESLNNISDKLLEYSKYLKDTVFVKDERNKVELSIKRIIKSSLLIQSAYTENLSKQLSSMEKISLNKSSGVKKIIDKEKSAIHKKLNVQPFLLNFMKLEPGTLVSRSDALSSITSYVKQEKVKNPDIIVESDKRSFKLIGELKTLFDGIYGIMATKGQPVDNLPEQIKYTQIMQYMTHCFIKDENTIQC